MSSGLSYESTNPFEVEIKANPCGPRLLIKSGIRWNDDITLLALG